MNDLRVLFFEITSKCNANCKHCGSRCDINSPEGISKELFCSVLDDVKENFGTKSVMLNITGGEPLIRKDLFEIMKYASNLGFSWGMVTNGTLITKDVIEKMKETKMSTISISIDGVGKTHEDFRGLPGSFDRILSNIKLLKKAKILEHIQVTFIANKKNIGDLEELYNILNDIGIDSLRISSIDPIGRAEDNKDLLLEKNDFIYLSEFIKEKNKIKKNLPCVWSCSHYLGKYLDREFRCMTGINVGSILSNGDIFVCPNVPRKPELIQGNIKVDKFSEVWKNGFKEFRNRKLVDKCEKCSYKDKCKGDSLHTFDFDKNEPKFCYKDIFEVSLEKYKEALSKELGDVKVLLIGPDENVPEIIILPEAFNDIKNYFHMGKFNPTSMYEQQMGLVGEKIENSYFVRYVFPSFLKNRTNNMAYVDNSTIVNALEETNIIKDNLRKLGYNESVYNLEFLGFAHSHPMDTDFCYSEGDEKFHKNLYKMFGDYIGVLINPQENLIVGFYGKDCEQATLKLIKKVKNK